MTQPADPRQSAKKKPHDGLFRTVFQDPVHAAPYLRSVLPAGIVRKLDLDKLTEMPRDFMSSGLNPLASDVLSSVPQAGHTGPLLIINDHQRKADKSMAFRLLCYGADAGRAYQQKNKDPNTKSLPAPPPVIPLVTYNGDRPWARPPTLHEVLGTTPGMLTEAGPALPDLEFYVDDLNQVSLEGLRARALTPAGLLVLVLLKIASRNTSLDVQLRPWGAVIREVLDQDPSGYIFEAAVEYINIVSETPAERLQQLFSEIDLRAGEAYMSTAQTLEARGEARGKAIGRELGEASGRAEVIVQQLTTRFGPLPETMLAMVNSGSASQLQTWADRVLTAGTLEQVFSTEPLAEPAATGQRVPAPRRSRGIFALPGIRGRVRRVRARRSR